MSFAVASFSRKSFLPTSWRFDDEPEEEVESGGGSAKKLFAASGINPVLATAVLYMGADLGGLTAKPKGPPNKTLN